MGHLTFLAVYKASSSINLPLLKKLSCSTQIFLITILHRSKFQNTSDTFINDLHYLQLCIYVLRIFNKLVKYARAMIISDLPPIMENLIVNPSNMNAISWRFCSVQ